MSREFDPSNPPLPLGTYITLRPEMRISDIEPVIAEGLYTVEALARRSEIQQANIRKRLGLPPVRSPHLISNNHSK
ncbi:MAG: hypothetical protein V1697_03050 [Candidatus Levyibacteriota bacterium]